MAKTKEELELEKKKKALSNPFNSAAAIYNAIDNPSGLSERDQYIAHLSERAGTDSKAFEMWKAMQDDVPEWERQKLANGGYTNPSISAYDEMLAKQDAVDAVDIANANKHNELYKLESAKGNLTTRPDTYTGIQGTSTTTQTLENTTGDKETKTSAPKVTYDSVLPTGVTSSPIAGVDTDTYNGMFQQYAPSADVQRATALTQAQLDKLMEGRTQYTDKLNSLIDAYGNRDSFAYDPNADMLYQNYLTAMQNAGQMAMKDTMGQAAALTGGYGSTYATAAANGAYNNYLQTANDNLVNFYNMALDRYKLEGDEALQNINLAQLQDSTEWNRMLNEYEAASNRENTLYGRDYQNFADQVNQYNTRASMMNNDYWRDQSNRLATDQFNAEMNYKYDVLDENAAARAQEQENWQKEFDFNVEQSEAKATNAIIEAAQKQAAEESSNDAKWGGRTNAQITNLYLDAYNVIKSAGNNETKQKKALVAFFETQNNLSREAAHDIEEWLDKVISGKVKVNKWED